MSRTAHCSTKRSSWTHAAATFVEASLVIENRYGYDGLRDLDLFVAAAGIEIIPVDVDQAYLARQAFHQYGEAQGQPQFWRLLFICLSKIYGLTSTL